jgi:diacylglycerol kinase family enzyme
LNLPLNFKKALDKCVTGKSILIDAVFFNERSFFCTAGIGFDANVAHEFAQSKSRGFISYVTTSFKSILNYQPIEVQIEKENIQKIFSLTFANANQFGNNAYISPNSDLQDGTFEIIQIQPLSPLELVKVGTSLFLKKINQNKKVKITKSSELKIWLPIGTKMHLDGENLFITQEQNIVKIEKNALKVIV